MLIAARATSYSTNWRPPLPNDPIKLYFAILNHGWLRREFASSQLPEMQKTPGVKLYWEEPSKTWGHPIYSNRNAIVKRFLSTDCDFLMMQDDDIVPVNHNPAELVFADKDVVGCPAKVRSREGTLDWVAYATAKVGDTEGYVACDLGRAPTHADLVAVDIVGTGLICIKRRVIEGIVAKFPGVGPFTVHNNEDGILDLGTDFAFCKRAKEAGFEVYTTPHRLCEHYKELGFLGMDGYDDSDFMDASNGVYGIPWGGWAINQTDWHFIKRAIAENGVQRVLEFGSGLSSLLMSEAVPVLSYETDPKHAEEIRAKAKDNFLAIREWDGVSEPPLLAQRGPFDLVFIDGPAAIHNGGPGRERAYAAAAATGARLIITHDSGRREELEWAARFLRGKYDIVAVSGHHEQRSVLWRLRE